MVSHSAAETEQIACTLAQNLPKGTKAVALLGDLGAGKTTFARGFMAGLGFLGPVTSPTYAFVNEYRDDLFHFDWYRLSGAEELYELGWEDYLERGLCVVEWSERAPELLPAATLRVNLASPEGNTRHISISGYGQAV